MQQSPLQLAKARVAEARAQFDAIYDSWVHSKSMKLPNLKDVLAEMSAAQKEAEALENVTLMQAGVEAISTGIDALFGRQFGSQAVIASQNMLRAQEAAAFGTAALNNFDRTLSLASQPYSDDTPSTPSNTYGNDEDVNRWEEREDRVLSEQDFDPSEPSSIPTISGRNYSEYTEDDTTQTFSSHSGSAVTPAEGYNSYSGSYDTRTHEQQAWENSNSPSASYNTSSKSAAPAIFSAYDANAKAGWYSPYLDHNGGKYTNRPRLTKGNARVGLKVAHSPPGPHFVNYDDDIGTIIKFKKDPNYGCDRAIVKRGDGSTFETSITDLVLL